ncbi:MAG: ABC transporter substrate-binding protein [Prevotella sp.]|nr:ABC transporter substrate-binding protein [Prevotella sp.]
MMRKICFLIAATLLIGCGQSYEETKKQTRLQRIRAAKEDSAALKIAVLPTLDGLPLFVLKELQLYDTAVVDIRLKRFTAQMDCDTALMGTAAEGMMSDLVRSQRLAARGYKMRYMASMNTCWQLISNRNARVRELKQMEDKTVAMTRYSATDLLTDLIVDSAHVKSEHVYRVQVNDVNVRLKMLQNNVLDLLWLTEPQATAAKKDGRKLTDTRQLGLQLGVIVFRQDKVRTLERRNQMEELSKAYDRACDSINKYGIGHYRDIIVNYCGVDAALVDSLPADMKFRHAGGPLQRDMERVDKWLKSR